MDGTCFRIALALTKLISCCRSFTGPSGPNRLFVNGKSDDHFEYMPPPAVHPQPLHTSFSSQSRPADCSPLPLSPLAHCSTSFSPDPLPRRAQSLPLSRSKGGDSLPAAHEILPHVPGIGFSRAHSAALGPSPWLPPLPQQEQPCNPGLETFGGGIGGAMLSPPMRTYTRPLTGRARRVSLEVMPEEEEGHQHD